MAKHVFPLARIQGRSFIDNRPDARKYGRDKPALKVTLGGAGGKTLAAVEAGKSGNAWFARREGDTTIFPLVRSVEPAKGGGADAVSLVQTSDTSWAEKDVAGVFKQGRASLGPDDKKGPISIAVAATANLKKLGVEKPGDVKVVVVGTAAFANNRYINIFFNRDFFLNAANWLVGQEEMISIRSRSVRSSRVQLTDRESAAIFYFSFLVPELLLLAGLAVWWRRR